MQHVSAYTAAVFVLSDGAPICCDQAEYAAMSSKLAEVSEQLADREAELRGKLNVNELQLKEQIVFNVSLRQGHCCRAGVLAAPRCIARGSVFGVLLLCWWW